MCRGRLKSLVYKPFKRGFKGKNCRGKKIRRCEKKISFYIRFYRVKWKEEKFKSKKWEGGSIDFFD